MQKAKRARAKATKRSNGHDLGKTPNLPKRQNGWRGHDKNSVKYSPMCYAAGKVLSRG